uniref:Transcriptional regulator ATRX n=1 Tax=Echinococcus granulosus TaxID=6210 RepID=A0A068WF62_ECHGR|nr:Transcriptional regulator ATRX [Echinococcus granulosus]
MPSRLKRSGGSQSSPMSDNGSTTDSTASSAFAKRRKPSVNSRNSDPSATLQHVRSRNSRPNMFNDSESITISSDSESSESAADPKHRQSASDSVITEQFVNPHSLVDADSQHLTTTSAFDDEIMIFSSSSSSPEKNFSNSIIQRQRIESSDSDEETRKKTNKVGSLSALNETKDEDKCKIVINSSSFPSAKNSSNSTVRRAATTSCSGEENIKPEGSKPMKTEEDGDVGIPNQETNREITLNFSMEGSTVKPIIRRRKIASSGSDDEGNEKVTDNKSMVVGGGEEVKVGQNTCEIALDYTTANSGKSALRRRNIASSGSDEETAKKANGDGSMGMESGGEVEIDKSTRKRGRSMKHRLRRCRRSSSSSSSSSNSSNSRSRLSDLHVDEDSGMKERRGENKKAAEEKAKRDAREEEEGAEEGEDVDDKDGRKGRKKIRKILKDKKLSSETKNAEALERERRKRLEERQRLYNSVLEDANEGSASKSSRLVLDFKKDSDDPLVEVHPDFVKHLKPHQVQAVRFLYDNIIESVEEHKENRSRLSGAILAHCMGLGKSLSTIAFIHTLLINKEVGLGISTCLILCPVNTLLNWHREWRHWMPENAEVNVYELATAVANNFRIDVIRHWHSEGGILLMGYDMYRNITTSLLKKTRKQAYKKLIPTALIDPGPDVVVCDEGHLLKNCKTGVTKAINNLKTPKRVILTGTPLQNNLSEYWTMVNFVKPNLLGSAREFANRFVNPIKNGQHSNSTQRDVQLMKKRAHVLFKTLDGCVQRRDYGCLTQYLPPRLEYVLKIRLSSVQCELYRAFLQHRLEGGVSGSSDDQRNTLFRDQQTLYRVWTHPYTLRMHETREARRLLLEDSTSEDEEKVDEDESSTSVSELETDSGGTVNSRSKSVSSSSDVVATKITLASSRSTRARLRQMRRNASVVDILDSEDETNQLASTVVGEGLGTEKRVNGKPDNASESDLLKPWWYSFYRDEYDLRIDVGAKLSTLFFILKKCSEIGDKVLVFSQSLFSLDLIEWFLAAIDRQWCMSQGLEVDTNSKQSQELDKLLQSEAFEMPSLVDYFSDMDRNTWRRGYDYERIDGSLSAVQRNSLQTRFNSPSQRFRLLIISTKAGGLGVNLTAANRLVIFDVSWNPSHDVQSIFRSYRFGQTKPVYIYRMVAQGTMEEKMYDRQVTKQSLALRVIDEQQIDRHFKEEDLRELYTFDPDAWDVATAEKRSPPVLPRDRLLADLLSDHPNLVVSYHNHDSLLENRLDEGLSEAERAEAWREYEEEKRVGRPMTDYQRLLLNNPEAAAALMAQRQRIEEEQRQRMMAMAAAYAAATASNRMPYASINPSPLGLIDSMYTTVSAHTLTSHRPEPSSGSRPPQQQQREALRPIAPRLGTLNPQLRKRDVFWESFNAMRNMLLTRYPMLARSPSTLHDMALRLFVNSVAGNVAAQNTLAIPHTVAPPSSSSMPSSSAAAASNITVERYPAPNFSEPVIPTSTIASTPVVVDVDDSSNDDS